MGGGYGVYTLRCVERRKVRPGRTAYDGYSCHSDPGCAAGQTAVYKSHDSTWDNPSLVERSALVWKSLCARSGGPMTRGLLGIRDGFGVKQGSWRGRDTAGVVQTTLMQRITNLHARLWPRVHVEEAR